MHVCTNALQHVACGKWQGMCVLMREVTFEMRFVRCMLCMLIFVIVIVVSTTTAVVVIKRLLDAHKCSIYTYSALSRALLCTLLPRLLAGAL